MDIWQGDPFIHIANHLPLIDHLYLSLLNPLYTNPLAAFRAKLADKLKQVDSGLTVSTLDQILIDLHGKLYGKFLLSILMDRPIDEGTHVDIIVPSQSAQQVQNAISFMISNGFTISTFDNTCAVWDKYYEVLVFFHCLIATDSIAYFAFDVERNWYDGKTLHIGNVNALRNKKCTMLYPDTVTYYGTCSLFNKGYIVSNLGDVVKALNWIKMDCTLIEECEKQMKCKVHRLTWHNSGRMVTSDNKFSTTNDLLDYLEEQQYNVYRSDLDDLGLPLAINYIGHVDARVVGWHTMRAEQVYPHDRTISLDSPVDISHYLNYIKQTPPTI